MHRPKTPLLNVGRLSDGRYKFSFSSQHGTIFCELSAHRHKSGPDQRSEHQKLSEAVARLRLLVKTLDAFLDADQPK